MEMCEADQLKPSLISSKGARSLAEMENLVYSYTLAAPC